MCDLDFAELYRASLASRAPLAVAVCERESKIDLGVLELDDVDLVTQFREKPSYRFWVSMGLYAACTR